MDARFTPGHALVVGVGADLPNTVADATGLARILRDPGRCAYPPGQVHLLTGEEADRAAVLSALDALSQLAGAQSTALVYFSGHGYRAQTSIGEAYYLLHYGYDSRRLSETAINGREFADGLGAIPARKLLVLLDCCHAGGVGGAKAPGAGVELTRSPLPPEAMDLLTEGGGRVLIASSQEDELSFAGKPYSAFTLALIEALAGVGVAREDGYVRVADLALHARQVVPGRTNDRQHPILHFEHADNFVLAYYAGGDARPKGLPFDVEPQIEPQPGAWTLSDQRAQVVHGPQINVVGDVRGPVLSGQLGDRITVTGDGNVIGDRSRSTVVKRAGLQLDGVAALLDRALALARRKPPPVCEDLEAAVDIVREEIEAGEAADKRLLSQALDVLLEKGPDVLEIVLDAMLDPGASAGKGARMLARRARKSLQ
jgi:hypothetical protein